MPIEWVRLPSILDWNDKVAYLAAEFSLLPQIPTPLEHRFEPFWYIRRMTIPAGTLFIGRKHRFGHLVDLLEGEAVLIAPQGNRIFTPPATIQTPPGFAVVAYILQDVIAETRHPNPTESRDTQALEDAMFEPAKDLIDRGLELKRRLIL